MFKIVFLFWVQGITEIAEGSSQEYFSGLERGPGAGASDEAPKIRGDHHGLRSRQGCQNCVSQLKSLNASLRASQSNMPESAECNWSKVCTAASRLSHDDNAAMLMNVCRAFANSILLGPQHAI